MDNKEKVIKAFKDSEEPLNATKVSQISGVDKRSRQNYERSQKRRNHHISQKVLLGLKVIFNIKKSILFFTVWISFQHKEP